MSLKERDEKVEKIRADAATVLASLVECMGYKVEKVDGHHVHFEIDGKKYYLYVNVNRNRKSHFVSEYVGHSCGDSMNDSMYTNHEVFDEEA